MSTISLSSNNDNENNFTSSLRTTLTSASKLPESAKFTIVLGCFLLYFLYVYHEHGFQHGVLLTGLLWSFFILFIPLPEADLVVSFPIRILWNIPLQYIQIFIFMLAFAIVAGIYITNKNVFTKSSISQFLLNAIQRRSSPYIIMLLSSMAIAFILLYFQDTLITSFIQDDYSEFTQPKTVSTGIILSILIVIYAFSAIYIAKQTGGFFG